ncbi:MAG: hypothetical protein JNK92_10395 [Dechloromonas sp.]|nr:hypothetical protein [Dechloromonas sp.]
MITDIDRIREALQFIDASDRETWLRMGMANDDWLERLHGLAYRFESLGVTADLAAMSLCELWALYAFLRRLSEGA